MSPSDGSDSSGVENGGECYAFCIFFVPLQHNQQFMS